jgi:hypothetical protein
LGSQTDWRSFREFNNIAGKLKPGRNVLAVRTENVKSDVTQNPAGLAAGLVVEFGPQQRIEVPTDTRWRASREEAPGWQKPEFDDAGWIAAKSVAKFGAAPWGQVGSQATDPYAIPYAMGIPRQTRIIYVLKPEAVSVAQLEPDVQYAAFQFDPVTGDRKPLGDVKPDDTGAWRCEPSAGTTHDWVLILEAKK